MNIICPYERCTGCQACAHLCPEHCIQMEFDSEGFLYPQINKCKCTDCGVCQDVCPSLHDKVLSTDYQQTAFACWHKDKDVQYASSSGGFFTALANQIILDGGVVYGAAYNDRMVVRHLGVETVDDLRFLRGSKYVQSDVVDTYDQVHQLLKQGRKVLFTGTPCQISGLYAAVGSGNKNLVTCDFACHGVPSPKVFEGYVDLIQKKYKKHLNFVTFRDKKISWDVCLCVGYFVNKTKKYLTRQMDSSFLQIFIDNVVLRPVCHHCTYVTRERVADLTFADFWEIPRKEISFNHDYRNGVSKVLVNTGKGQFWLQKALNDLCFEQRTIEEATRVGNLSGKPSFKSRFREQFFKDFQQYGYARAVKRYFRNQGWKPFVRGLLPPRLMYFLRKSIS